MSPLLWAVSQHHYTTAAFLLDHGADPNQPKKDLVTPVGIAAPVGDLAMTTLLVERGADVNRPDENGQTPLFWVAFYGHLSVADYLVRRGAKVDVVDRFRQTPLSMAEGQHRDEMIAFLTAHGAVKR
jgi:ankyrin repeat protein